MRRAALLSLALLSGCSSAPQHYAQSCSTPLSNWQTQNDGEPAGKILVQLDKSGSIQWDHKPITPDELERRLGMTGDMPWPTRVTLRIDPAVDCTAVRALRHRMDRTSICAKQKMCSEG